MQPTGGEVQPTGDLAPPPSSAPRPSQNGHPEAGREEGHGFPPPGLDGRDPRLMLGAAQRALNETHRCDWLGGSA